MNFIPSLNSIENQTFSTLESSSCCFTRWRVSTSTGKSRRVCWSSPPAPSSLSWAPTSTSGWQRNLSRRRWESSTCWLFCNCYLSLTIFNSTWQLKRSMSLWFIWNNLLLENVPFPVEAGEDVEWSDREHFLCRLHGLVLSYRRPLCSMVGWGLAIQNSLN